MPTLTLRVSTMVGVGLDGDRFRHAADLQRDVDRARVADGEHDAGLLEAAEPAEFGGDLVGTNRQVGEDILSARPETTNRVMPVSVCLTVTSTPGRAPPESSTTVPESWATATVWANALIVSASAIAMRHITRTLLHRIATSP